MNEIMRSTVSGSSSFNSIFREDASCNRISLRSDLVDDPPQNFPRTQATSKKGERGQIMVR